MPAPIKNPMLLDYVDEAKKYYKAEYLNVEGARGYSMKKSIKYFDALKLWYANEKMVFIAHQMGMEAAALKVILSRTQERVEMFLKLKRMGKL